MAIVLITHDLGVVAGSCVETLVMYGGQVMEHGTTDGDLRPARRIPTRWACSRPCRGSTRRPRRSRPSPATRPT